MLRIESKSPFLHQRNQTFYRCMNSTTSMLANNSWPIVRFEKMIKVSERGFILGVEPCTVKIVSQFCWSKCHWQDFDSTNKLSKFGRVWTSASWSKRASKVGRFYARLGVHPQLRLKQMKKVTLYPSVFIQTSILIEDSFSRTKFSCIRYCNKLSSFLAQCLLRDEFTAVWSLS